MYKLNNVFPYSFFLQLHGQFMSSAESVRTQECKEVCLSSSTDAVELYGIISKFTEEEEGDMDRSILSEVNGYTFSEMGGDSFAAMTAFNELADAGYDIGIEDFATNIQINKAHCNNTNKIDLGLQTKCSSETGIYGMSVVQPSLLLQYEMQKLTSASKKEHAIPLLAQEFSSRNPLDLLAGTSGESIERYMRSIWQHVIADDLSLVIVDRETHSIVAVTINLNLETELEPVSRRTKCGLEHV